jgi:hypothetical protein
MLEKLLPYKTYVLSLGCLILLWTGYQLALKKTWEAYLLHRQLSTQLGAASDISYPPAYLERKGQHLTELLGKYTSDTLSFKNKVISAVSPLAESGHCKVVAVSSDVSSAFTTVDYQVQKVSLSGAYVPLVQLLQRIEASSQAGLVRSAVWHMVELHNGVRNSKQLILDIYLLDLKKIN